MRDRREGREDRGWERRLVQDLARLRAHAPPHVDATARVLREIRAMGPAPVEEMPLREVGWGVVAACLGAIALLVLVAPPLARLLGSSIETGSPGGMVAALAALVQGATGALAGLARALAHLAEGASPFWENLLLVARCGGALAIAGMAGVIVYVVARDLRTTAPLGLEEH